MLINKLTVKEIQQRMAEGLLTSEALVKLALDSIEQYTDHNAFITVDGFSALAQAKHYDELREKGDILGPLHGIPLAVKDNIHVSGLPNTAGTPALKNFIPSDDAGVISLMKEAGAIVIGKTNLHELAYGITSNNKVYGPVKNAIDKTLFAGGSSGGSAVSVALGMAPIALGTDTGGSARVPAALNGVVGFRPSVTRYSDQGLTGISNTRDTVGLFTSSIEDAQLLDVILSESKDESEKASLVKCRIGVPREYFYDDLEPEIAEKTDTLLNLLKDQGAELVYVDIKDVGALNEQVGFPVVLHETKVLLTEYIKQNLPNETFSSLVNQVASPDVKGIMEMILGGAITEEVYNDALNRARPEMQALMSAYFADQNIDAIIFPTTPLTAKPIEGSDETVDLNSQQVPTFQTFIRNTDPASNAGLPGLSIPLGVTKEGLPIGIEIDGPINSDPKLLAIGLEIEKLIKKSSI